MIRLPNIKSPPKPPPLHIDKWLGINTASTPTQIATNELADLRNVMLDEEYALDQRWGYDRVFTDSLGTGTINGMTVYRKLDGTEEQIFAYGTKLYKDWASPTELYTGIENKRVKFFTVNDKLYILDGVHYLVYDGSNVVTVESVAYIPKITMGRSPTGGGTSFEQINLLQPGFTDSFSTVAGTKTYQLSFKALDAKAYIVKINGATKTLTTDYTEDRVNGTVTLVADPGNGTDNLEVTAFKTISGYSDYIKKNTDVELYGGANDTRVFLYGNSDYPNRLYRSGITSVGTDPTYFPYGQFQDIGSNADKIMKLSKQYDVAVIHKEHSKWSMTYDSSSGLFPVKPVNDTSGCIAKESVQILDNFPVSLAQDKAIYQLNGGTVRDERNVQHISKNVDKLLINEANIDKAVSVDFGGKYILCANNNAYVFDYRKGAWFVWDNIPANVFCEYNNELYFGGQGLIYKFNDSKNDDGVAVNAYVKTKMLSFDADEYYKQISEIFFSMKPWARASMKVLYTKESTGSEWIEAPITYMDLIDLSFIDFERLSFSTSLFPQETKLKSKVKKVVFFQLMFQNNNTDEGFSLLSAGIRYDVGGEVK